MSSILLKVVSNSDREGNITQFDVKRRKFESNITLVPESSADEHSTKSPVYVKDEIERNDECKLNSTKRYGFRTRRLKDHRVKE